ncbi:uncharacterized protein LOC112566423 [Pomacea canaliculata]|uniref:uncharacterized protein LOC112566423 n=1 Tax=Pomacea canaliculata TaxID=400727 RepID=UPI000D73CC5A|nr:uncharacterized protein LOC112566423 [Pomacea canaliculata]
MKTTTLSTVMLLMLLMAVALGSVIVDELKYPFAVNCEEPRICTPDLIPYCIKGRRDPVRGHCELQDAICNGEELDPSNSCFLPYPVRCDRPAGQRPAFVTSDPSVWWDGRSPCEVTVPSRGPFVTKTRCLMSATAAWSETSLSFR